MKRVFTPVHEREDGKPVLLFGQNRSASETFSFSRRQGAAGAGLLSRTTGAVTFHRTQSQSQKSGDPSYKERFQ